MSYLGRLGWLCRYSLSTLPRLSRNRDVTAASWLRGLWLGPLGLAGGLRVRMMLRPDRALPSSHLRGRGKLGVGEGGPLLLPAPPPLVQLLVGPHPAELVVPAAEQTQLVADLGDGGQGDCEAVGEKLLVQLLVGLGTGAAVRPVRPDLVLELVGLVRQDAVEAGVSLLEAAHDGPGLGIAAVLGVQDLLDPRPGRLVMVEPEYQVLVLVEVSTGSPSSGHSCFEWMGEISVEILMSFDRSRLVVPRGAS